MTQSLILDTSLFVNPAVAHVFGASPTAAFTRFLEMAQETPDLAFYMPPSIYAELMHFCEEPKVPNRLLLLIQKKPPKKHEIQVPGLFIYHLVESMRDRVDRGLRLAESHVREALEVPPSPKGSPADPQKIRADADVIGRLRETYRRIMREGMLDSKADVDLLLLAYEVQGTLVSADQGVLDWGESMGITILSAEHLHDLLVEKVKKKSV